MAIISHNIALQLYLTILHCNYISQYCIAIISHNIALQLYCQTIEMQLRRGQGQ